LAPIKLSSSHILTFPIASFSSFALSIVLALSLKFRDTQQVVLK